MQRLRLKPATDRAPVGASSRPALRDGVDFVAPAETDGDRWLVTVGEVPVARVSAATVRVMERLDGDQSLHAIAEAAGYGLDVAEVLRLVQHLDKAGLLAGSKAHGRAGDHAVSYLPPLTVQFATRRAPALFARLAPLGRVLYAPVVLGAEALIVAAGLVVAGLSWRDYYAVGAAPLTVSTLITALLALVTATMFHELAHGMALTRYGGTPRRAGFMLFYLTPAFFVDVTDGWKLPRRTQRAATAFAGPWFHLTAAAAATILAAVIHAPTVHDALVVFALAASVVFAFNLIPFVRFDGYLVLMCLLDRPGLRTQATDELSWLAFDHSRATAATRPMNWPLACFGLASALAPVLLVFYALRRITGFLSGTGPLTALAVIALEAFLAVIAVRGVIRLLRSSRDRRRSIAVVGGLLAAVALAGFAVHVPLSSPAGFISDSGHAYLVSADKDALEHAAGGHVALKTQGLIFQRGVGAGRVAGGGVSPHDLDLEALLPLRVSGLRIPGYGVPLLVDPGSPALPRAGLAVVTGDTSVTAWEWSYRNLVEPFTDSLLGLLHPVDDDIVAPTTTNRGDR